MKIAEIKGREILDSRGIPLWKWMLYWNQGLWAVPLSHRVRQPVNMRLWNYVMATRPVTEAKAY